MSYYFVAQIRINNAEEYKKYLEKVDDVFSQYNGEYLAVDKSQASLNAFILKGILIILFFLISGLSAKAFNYYVVAASEGGNNKNNGAKTSPWLTLAYACSQVPSGPHTIYIGAGTFKETSPSILAAGVSIEGQGDSTLLISSVSNAATILLSSRIEGSKGNQAISYIKMDGGLIADRAIDVIGRSNVIIHHVEIVNFFTQGISFYGKSSTSSGMPKIFASGNKIHNSKIINCAKYVVGDQGYGNVRIGGQIGIEIHDCIIEQIDRGTNMNGFGIKFCGGGWNKALKIYNCNVKVPPIGESEWDFAVELFHNLGGFEIYNNTFQGTVDFSSSAAGDYRTFIAGDYDFAGKIHDNVIHQEVMRPGPEGESGIDIEHNAEGGIYIFRNYFANLQYPIRSSLKEQIPGYPPEQQNDWYIYHNVITDVGIAGTNLLAIGMMLGHSASGVSYNNWNIWNNTIYAGKGAKPAYGIRLQFRGKCSNISVRNNIISGFTGSPIHIYNSTIDGLSIENNLFYENGTNTPTYAASIVTNETRRNNIEKNPLWLSTNDFRLRKGSPAIGAGIDVGLESDFSGAKIVSPPDIGALRFVPVDRTIK